ncbi:hypothetical protein H9Y04_34140 [Streptomyces sp. TRM66268-LWL]|uniref:DUF6542 domain-containing protein n=1 Tax=Streptomyces polyasparticus TaxID=2767826 RepID=A0ABR7SRS2_9ACTN|nr:hypothetical protein [Streptomyces polyasparticus]
MPPQAGAPDAMPGPRRGGAARPVSAGPPAARAVRGGVLAVRRGYTAVRTMPNPRLTGLGAGLFATVALLFVACVDRLLFGESAVLYGCFFLLISVLTAVWVRPADLVTAPVAVPIAFALGLLPIAGGSGGLGGQLMGVMTALALNAGWLYGGTLVAGLISTVRKAREMNRRRALRAAAHRPPHRRPEAPRARRP